MFEVTKPLLVGMVHLPPLPGSPNHSLSLAELIERAVADAHTLADAGFGALLVENFGDAPFSAEGLEPVTIASMGIIVAQVRSATLLPVGVNALRNDARAALGIAVAAEASFIRVNVHTGVAATDQGMVEGRADETLRLRQRLNPDVGIFADVHVKHAAPISQPDLVLAAEETAYRGMADALILTGPTTGRPTDLDNVRRVKRAVPDRLVLVGSGVSAETVADVLAAADGVIVGTGVKSDGRTAQPVDAQLARAFVRAATGSRADG